MFGVCTHETRHLSFPGETVFANVIETSKRAVDFLLEQGSDVIVALTHQSIQEDQELAKYVTINGPFPTRPICGCRAENGGDVC